MTDTAERSDYLSYADFGRRFFELAVTPERVAKAAGRLAGRPIDVGPDGVGPMGLVKVRATGQVGQPVVDAVPGGPHVAFTVRVPLDLALTIDMGLDRYRFTADVVVHLDVAARAAEPLRIVIDIEAPSPEQVDVELRADGVRASVVRVIGGVEGELKRSVAKVVRAELAKPEARAARVIDVADAVVHRAAQH